MHMFDKVLNMVKTKDILVPRLLLLNYKSFNISDQELILIIYLLGLNNNIYNPKDISNDLNLELIEVLTIVSDLTDKGIIKIDMEQEGNKKVEVLNLEQLYTKLAFLIVNEQPKEDISIFNSFESELGRTLSPIELDIINAWKDNEFSDEIILLALKEAIYNGVTSLKYIDKILDEWKKKGIKNKDDVEKSRKQFKETKTKNKEVFSYDWLNDEE